MRQIHTGLRIMRIEWDYETEEIVSNDKNMRSDYLNSVSNSLNAGYSRLIQIIAALDKSGDEYEVDDVVSRFHAPETIVGFLSFARKQIAYLSQIGKTRCAEHYSTSLNSFIRFNGEDEVSFRDFSVSLVQRYEWYLRSLHLTPNSTSYYMRNLRAIYNKAVESGITEQAYPFRHVYTGIAKTVKRAISLPTVKALRSLDLRHDPQSELARDVFLFSLYTRGMAIIDVAYLRKSNLKDGTLTYRRRKTGQQLSIRWERQMQEIVNRHASKDTDFLFPLIDSGKPDSRKQFLCAYNRLRRHLLKIGQQLGLSEPLTFHRSRHSWASIAREHNIPLSVICEGMGHDSEKTTRIYLASLDTSIVDKANSEILELFE